jgi:hypothetical protein
MYEAPLALHFGGISNIAMFTLYVEFWPDLQENALTIKLSCK